MWSQLTSRSRGEHRTSEKGPGRAKPDGSKAAATGDLADPPVESAGLVAVRDAMQDFRATHNAGTFSVSRTIDPLLDLWGSVSEIDRGAAIPIESLLTVLVRRSLTTSAELLSMLDHVEALLEEPISGATR